MTMYSKATWITGTEVKRKSKSNRPTPTLHTIDARPLPVLQSLDGLEIIPLRPLEVIYGIGLILRPGQLTPSHGTANNARENEDS